MEKLDKEKMSKIKWVIPFVHYLAGVNIWLTHKTTIEYPFGITAAAYDTGLSLNAESILFECMIVIMGLIMVMALWKLLFFCFKMCPKRAIFIFAVSVLVSVLIVPYNYAFETDDLLIYILTKRGIPEYWHGIYQGVLYGGSMIVYMHPATICCMQLAAFLGFFFYAQERISKLYGAHKSWLVFVGLLFPSATYVALNPYRNDINAVLCLWMTGILILDSFEGRKRNKKQILFLCVALGAMIVYRRENILLLILFAVVLFVTYHCKAKKTLQYLMVTMLVFGVVLVPQKMGEMKYYGNDYQIVNHMNTLQTIMQNENWNTSYKGFEEDLEAVQKIVPYEVIKEDGLAGYRAYNYFQKKTVNQSMVSKSEQRQFLRATKSIYMHNAVLYLKERAKMFVASNCYNSEIVEHTNPDVIQFVYEIRGQYQYNFNEMMYYCQQNSIWNIKFKNDIGFMLKNWINEYRNCLTESNVWFAGRMCVYMSFCVVTIWMVFIHREKCLLYFGIGVCEFSILVAIFLTEPEARRVDYFSPIIYMMAFTSLLMVLEMFATHNMKYIDEK